MNDTPTSALLQTVARLVTEEGLDYAAAKQRAVRALKLPARTPLPDNDALEAAVREHIALFCADTQAQELAALRATAVQWMQRLADFQPLIGGAIWHGTATRVHDVYLQLFTDDSKAVDIALINHRQPYQSTRVRGLHGQQVDALSLHVWCDGLGEDIGLHLLVNPINAQRGASLPDTQGRSPRGNVQQLLARMQDAPASP